MISLTKDSLSTIVALFVSQRIFSYFPRHVFVDLSFRRYLVIWMRCWGHHESFQYNWHVFICCIKCKVLFRYYVESPKFITHTDFWPIISVLNKGCFITLTMCQPELNILCLSDYRTDTASWMPSEISCGRMTNYEWNNLVLALNLKQHTLRQFTDTWCTIMVLTYKSLWPSPFHILLTDGWRSGENLSTKLFSRLEINFSVEMILLNTYSRLPL